MKKLKIVLICILAVAVAAIAAFGLWQRHNIGAIIDSVKYSEKELNEKIDDNSKKMQKIVDDTDYINVRGGLTPEEERAFSNGEITDAEALEIVKGTTTLEEIMAKKNNPPLINSESPKPSSNENSENAEQPPANEQQPDVPKEKTKEEIMEEEVSEIIAELYVVKSEFVYQIQLLAGKAYREFEAGGKDMSKATAIMNSYLPAVASLETSCDQRVNGLLADLEKSLKKGGGDLGLINEVRQCYYEEKALKKAHYLNQLYAAS